MDVLCNAHNKRRFWTTHLCITGTGDTQTVDCTTQRSYEVNSLRRSPLALEPLEIRRRDIGSAPAFPLSLPSSHSPTSDSFLRRG
jgi:hypothetical protein